MLKESSDPKAQEVRAAVQQLYRVQVRAEWNLEDLQALESLLQDKRFSSFLRWVGRMEELVDGRVWKADSFEQVRFLQGQYDAVQRFKPDRMLKEIANMKEELKQDVA